MLLEADPFEEMIDKYLDDGEMYVLFENGNTVAVAVVVDYGDECEIKNIAVDPKCQLRGYGSFMIRHLASVYRHKKRMIVGTSDYETNFYKKLGFVPYAVKKGFFSDYPEPVYENGELLTDMTMLAMDLTAAGDE
ncbi:MAG: GNAT family N-acetyltransferase [Clostridia bacterium]|nr:GNAT family N-acetyltransferase [Clostridia bacterium]